MRKLKLQIQTTIDGFIAGPNGEMDWTVQDWDAELLNYVGSLTDLVDTIVLGRKLAEVFIPYWLDVADNPENPEFDAGRKFMDTPKVVFSSSLQSSSWPNTVLDNGNLSEGINKLKRQQGQDIIAYGGAGFVGALLNEGLIDELHLFVNPSAIGKGLSIYDQLQGNRKYQLSNAIPFDCGIVVLCYLQKST